MLFFIRYLDATGLGVRHSQELHLHPGPVDGGGDAQGRPGAEGLGLGYREEEAEIAEKEQGLNSDSTR